MKVEYDQIHKLLNNCTPHMLRYIELQLNFAFDVQNFQSEFAVSNETFAQEFNCSEETLNKLKKGATEVSLRHLAKLRSMYASKYADKNARLQTP